MRTSRRLCLCDRPKSLIVQSDAAVKSSRRQPAGSIKAEAVDWPAIIGIHQDLLPVASRKYTDAIGAGKARGDMAPIRRPCQLVYDLGKPRYSVNEPARIGFEHVETVRFLPLEARPAAGHDEAAVRRHSYGFELALRAG